MTAVTPAPGLAATVCLRFLARAGMPRRDALALCADTADLLMRRAHDNDPIMVWAYQVKAQIRTRQARLEGP
jgi:hypothetical protein